ASTVKLIGAGDDERRRLGARLDACTRPVLRESTLLLGDALTASRGVRELEASVERASDQLVRAEDELAALAGGLGVPALSGGLAEALADLVRGLPLDVELRISQVECSAELATTIWFVCSEGVTNVLKHADASRLTIEVVERDAALRVLVEDD